MRLTAFELAPKAITPSRLVDADWHCSECVTRHSENGPDLDAAKDRSRDTGVADVISNACRRSP
jgi:hypothetical protein